MTAVIDLAWITAIVVLFVGGISLLWHETAEAWREYRRGERL